MILFTHLLHKISDNMFYFHCESNNNYIHMYITLSNDYGYGLL